MVIGILGLCAIGLIIIPELVYVRDIYEESYARSNTMFKLTYQAFILFGICMSYIITRFLLWKKERILQVFGGIGLVLLLWTSAILERACTPGSEIFSICPSTADSMRQRIWKMSFPRTQVPSAGWMKQ
ncbi:DUF2298 domain-containing protein [Blautia sp. OF11-22]|uniref:DUF2298 domain-containing protein n=1 Tax=Blautia sp. OF11-22 TaxID=2292982 RepID=UPI001FAA19C6|nr:DUF2298 domain-containing protein [Blautia sp. OF11-22]